jgi:Mrp family chromosome partitioning ATPase
MSSSSRTPTRELVLPASRAVVPLFHDRGHGLPAPLSEVIVNRHPLPHLPHPDLVLLTAPDGRRAARFRALRHRLAERGDPRAVLVTSAGPREGKTFVATNLALSLAELRRYRVLLIDANVRRPELARRFGLERGQHVCLLQQLEDHAHSPDAPWRVTALGRVDLHLLAIAPSSDRSRVLHGPSFGAALERLRGTYDYIVVDGASVLDGPEVNLIEDAVGTLLFAARAGVTRGKALRAALEQVSPTDVMGVALLGK